VTLTDDFVLRRARPDVEDEQTEGDDRSNTSIGTGRRANGRAWIDTSVRVRHLGVVTSTVTLKDESGEIRAYRNIKVFVDEDGRWRALTGRSPHCRSRKPTEPNAPRRPRGENRQLARPLFETAVVLDPESSEVVEGRLAADRAALASPASIVSTVCSESRSLEAKCA
jgi:hypothetical protein